MTAVAPGVDVDPARAELQQAVLAQLAGTLTTLSADELRALAEGRGRLVFSAEPAPTVLTHPGPPPSALPSPAALRAAPHRATTRPASRSAADVAIDVAIDVEVIRTLSTPDEVREYLAGRRFTVPVLRQLARALGPTVPASGRNRAELVHGIVEGTVGFRARSHALSGGAWAK